MTLQSYAGFTELQEIFTIAFSVFFGLMLSFAGGIRAFDTTPVYKGNIRPIARFTISVLILNLAPFGYFALILVYGLPVLGNFDFPKVIVTLALAIGVFGFSRIYYAVVTAGQRILYAKGELEQIKILKRDNVIGYHYHHTQYLFPGLMYILVPLGIFSIYVGGNFQCVTLIFIAIVIAVGVICKIVFSKKLHDAEDTPL